MLASKTNVRLAAQHLAANEPVLKTSIKIYGECTLRPHKNYFQELVESIIGQQISVKAGEAILSRFVGLFGGGEFPVPDAILQKTVDDLRTAGLSRGKATYVRDLAQRVVDGDLRFDHLDSLSNDEVVAKLTPVKGIGEWTAHMFLMFCMGRMDVLAHGDLGVQLGIQKLYKLKQLPSPADVKKLAAKNNWHPYESVACWYIWQSLDNAPKQQGS